MDGTLVGVPSKINIGNVYFVLSSLNEVCFTMICEVKSLFLSMVSDGLWRAIQQLFWSEWCSSLTTSGNGCSI